MALVTLEILEHLPHDVVTPGFLRRCHHLTLQGRRLLVLPQLGQCHRHRFAQVEGLLLLEQLLRHRHGPPPIADPIVGSGGQQAGQRASERRLSGVGAHPFDQPVTSLLVAAEADERHREAEPCLGDTRIDPDHLLALRQRLFQPSASS